jgi:hypothetical protein
MQVVVIWKRVRHFAASGDPADCPPFQPNHSGWLLLEKLRTMPKGDKPIRYDQMVRMTRDRLFWFFNTSGADLGMPSHEWCDHGWFDWLVRQGYYVVLTGDEYEVVALEQGVAA